MLKSGDSIFRFPDAIEWPDMPPDPCRDCGAPVEEPDDNYCTECKAYYYIVSKEMIS